MFAFLFGKKEAKIAGAIADPVADLRKREDDLEKKIRQLERIKESHHANAVEQKGRGNTQSALHFLKREKLMDDELGTANNMLFTIIQQRSALEQSIMNTESFNLVSRAVKTTQQTKWTADAVSDLIDEMEDVKNTSREISDLMKSVVGGSDDELLAELASLTCAPAGHELASLASTAVTAAELASLAAAPAASTAALQLPPVPTGSLLNRHTPSQQKKIDTPNQPPANLQPHTPAT